MKTITRHSTSHIAPFGLRMQPELKESLEDAAKINGRSLNAEIVSRLESSFNKSTALEDLSWPDLVKELRRIAQEKGASINISIGGDTTA